MDLWVGRTALGVLVAPGMAIPVAATSPRPRSTNRAGATRLGGTPSLDLASWPAAPLCSPVPWCTHHGRLGQRRERQVGGYVARRTTDTGASLCLHSFLFKFSLCVERHSPIPVRGPLSRILGLPAGGVWRHHDNVHVFRAVTCMSFESPQPFGPLAAPQP